jgi:serine/threonine-protein kinase
MSFAIGENVGAYRIMAQLGQGGMATVFKGYHPGLDRYVAIKVMHSAFKEDDSFLQRFNREARIVARLEHPNIVPVYDFSEHRGLAYLVMRFVDGETLKARLKRGALRPDQIAHVATLVGAALGYAHQEGVLHRDIKPSNILLTTSPDEPGSVAGVFLTDFGLARMAEAGESTLSRDMMVGTPQYISPEQAKGVRELDAGTDIYSLGVVLFELVTGRVPFSADTPYSVIHDHIFTPLPLPTSINPDVSETVERVLLRALAKERGDRYGMLPPSCPPMWRGYGQRPPLAPKLWTPALGRKPRLSPLRSSAPGSQQYPSLSHPGFRFHLHQWPRPSGHRRLSSESGNGRNCGSMQAFRSCCCCVLAGPCCSAAGLPAAG